MNTVLLCFHVFVSIVVVHYRDRMRCYVVKRHRCIRLRNSIMYVRSLFWKDKHFQEFQKRVGYLLRCPRLRQARLKNRMARWSR